MAKQRGLGKGLEALFADNNTDETQGAVTLKIGEIEPNREQPRKRFEEEALTQLAESIRTHGVIQPLLVRPLAGGGYQLVAGERRWRAARMAGLTEVPVVVKDLSEQETMEIALIENLQREDLNPIEEALGYQELMDAYGFTQEQVAKRVGKSRSAVANALRLIGLPEEVRPLLESGSLSAGHARALLALEDKAQMVETARLAVDKGLSVRELEKRAKTAKTGSKTAGESRAAQNPFSRDSYYDEMELALKEALHRKVKIASEGEKGTLQIEFYSREELRDLAARLAGNE
ncbi:MAG: ParB/RepB/Spo0J family partition protein [Oscillospiraceae bacterium]